MMARPTATSMDAVIRRAAGAEPAELRPLVDTAAQLLGPAPDPDHARELAALRSP